MKIENFCFYILNITYIRYKVRGKSINIESVMQNMTRTTIANYIEQSLVRGIEKNRWKEDFVLYVNENYSDLFKDVKADEISLKIRLDGVYEGFKHKDTKDIFGNLNTVTYKKENTFKVEKNYDDGLGFISENNSIDVDIKKKKTIVLLVKEMPSLIPAIKCILWSLDNKPKTIKDILQYLMKEQENGNIVPYLDGLKTQDDYTEVNNQINKSIIDGFLWLQKIKGKNGKTVFLYCNPTNKRLGYFYKGKLWKLKELSEVSGVKIGTIQRRFQTMTIEQSLGKI